MIFDDEFDGIPNTLSNGGPISLRRPFATYIPAGFTDVAAFLAYLDRNRLPYDLNASFNLRAASGAQGQRTQTFSDARLRPMLRAPRQVRRRAAAAGNGRRLPGRV